MKKLPEPPRPKDLSTPSFVTTPAAHKVRQVSMYDPAGQYGADRGVKGKGEDQKLTEEVGSILQTSFPGHLWGVKASHKQGIIQIMMPMVTNWSNVIKIANIRSPSHLRERVVRAGGEFLECYDMPRAGFDADSFHAAMMAAPIGRNENPEEHGQAREKQNADSAKIRALREDIMGGHMNDLIKGD